jgi:hypothetical protein
MAIAKGDAIGYQLLEFSPNSLKAPQVCLGCIEQLERFVEIYAASS